MSKILIIDDEDAIALLLTTALEKSGFNVEIAKDGIEGIRMFDNGQFDLVITDIRMKRLDGHGVLRHIRNSRKKLTPTVGISGTPWQLKQTDFDATFAKPFAIQPLIDTVRSLTNSRNTQAPKV